MSDDKNQTNEGKQKPAGKRPDQIHYAVRNKKDGSKDYVEIGLVYSHKDGKGSTIFHTAHAAGDRSVIRDANQRLDKMRGGSVESQQRDNDHDRE